MGSETLSQLDIDRLLGGRSKLTPHSAASLDVQVYDWRRPHRVSHLTVTTSVEARSLDADHELVSTFARSKRACLSDFDAVTKTTGEPNP